MAQSVKTYPAALAAVAHTLGEQAFDNSMGGSMQAWYGVNTHTAAATISTIYDVDYDSTRVKLEALADKAYEMISKEHYEGVRKRAEARKNAE